MPTLSRCRPISLLAAALLFTTACDSGTDNLDLAVRPEPTRLTRSDDATLRVPAATPFSITDSKFQTNRPGTGGGDANAQVDDGGSAAATTTASAGGSTSASFQLGHSIRNATDEQASVTVTAELAYTFEVLAEPELGLPDANVRLDLVIRNRRTRALRRAPLIAYASDKYSGRQESTTTFTTTILTPPGDTVDVFLAGTASCNSGPDRAATATLDVNDVTLTFTGDFAPAVEADDAASR